MSAVDAMSFEELVETLSSFEREMEPSDVDRAVHRAAVERRLMVLLCVNEPDAERRAFIRVSGDLNIKIYVGEDCINGQMRDIGEGGVRVASVVSPPEGAFVDMELLQDDKAEILHLARAQVKVAWVRPIGSTGFDLGLTFMAHDEGHRRRMRRVVIELLRRLPVPPD